MYNHEWHFFDLNGKKTVITIIDAEIYNVSDGKMHNGKKLSYRREDYRNKRKESSYSLNNRDITILNNIFLYS